jgi:hypothetical protein
MFTRSLIKLCSPALLALILLGFGLPAAYAQSSLVNVNDKFSPPEITPLGTDPNWGSLLCPLAFAYIFYFDATFTNSSTVDLTSLQTQVTTLTNGNLVTVGDGRTRTPSAVPQGGVLPWSIYDLGRGGYNDAVLSPGEAVRYGYSVCLTNLSRFRLLIDIVGAVLPSGKEF